MRNRLNLKTLDALMRVSLCGLEVDAMDWFGYHLQHSEKHARVKDTYVGLIVFFFATKQDSIFIIQNINFLKILCNPKLKWHFKTKCICQLTFIFVFENVTWHFGFEVECQMRFVNLHTHFSIMSVCTSNSRPVIRGTQVFSSVRMKKMHESSKWLFLDNLILEIESKAPN